MNHSKEKCGICHCHIILVHQQSILFVCFRDNNSQQVEVHVFQNQIETSENVEENVGHNENETSQIVDLLRREIESLKEDEKMLKGIILRQSKELENLKEKIDDDFVEFALNKCQDDRQV